ncbi:hypothetical protein PsYK624_077270 [Phanerochaete sordida]|uniref:Uncharacterized protein n=1 Tax=Phanerochaete sordida TaxID=48140 RepID=A0A9P3GBH2_9APHY|nr:hypothetical protein PsYK624_077270 [Phanerochaete sordida]
MLVLWKKYNVTGHWTSWRSRLRPDGLSVRPSGVRPAKALSLGAWSLGSARLGLRRHEAGYAHH